MFIIESRFTGNVQILFWESEPVSDPVISGFTQGTKRVVVCSLGRAGSCCGQARASLVLLWCCYSPLPGSWDLAKQTLGSFVFTVGWSPSAGAHVLLSVLSRGQVWG